MRENYWVNNTTNVELNVHCPAGSPRAWLLKAVGSPNGELYIMHGSMHPKSIAVAGLWYKDQARLPDTGNNKTLYRFFDLPEDLSKRYHKRYNDKVPYIGMCISVPANEVLTWIRAFKQSGCKWLWWAVPEPEPGINERPTHIPRYKRIDHNEVYTKLDQGSTVTQLATEYEVPINTIRYIWQKWKLNEAPSKSFSSLDEETVDQIRGDLVEGILTHQQIADRYNTTRITVSKWANRFGLGKGKKDVKTKAANSSDAY